MPVPLVNDRELTGPRERPCGPLCALVFGLAAPAACTLALWPWRHAVGQSSVLLVYLLGVFLVAIRQGRAASVSASFISAAAFAYFFAPPIYSLAVSDLENIIGLCVMLAVAHITSSLAERLRAQVDLASLREGRATALYRLSQALAEARDANDVVRIAERHAGGDFGASARLLLAPEGRLPADFVEGLSAVSAQHLAVDRIVAADAVIYLPLPVSHGCGGVLMLRPGPCHSPLNIEARTFLETYRSQIGQTLDRVRLAEEARDATIQAETEAMRNALLTAISHDLRTPLTRIVGTASALAHPSLQPEERREFSQAIQDEAQRMSELMSKILDMARLATGKLALHREWNAVEEIVGATLTRLDKALKDRPVHIRLPDGLPLVWVDAVLLQQVVMNLMDNVLKYAPAESPVEISAQFTDSTVSLSVSDRGPGIPDGCHERIFEKFYRVETESACGGVGLGLALCRAIAGAHGGTLEARNRPDGGAVFTLTLPRRESPPGWEENASAEVA